MPRGESTTGRVRFVMRRILTPALWLLAAGVLCPAASELEVTAVRFWTLSEVTRVAVETSGEFRFRADRLNNPDRLFFDVLGAKPRARGLWTTQVNDKLLKRIRVAETQPGMTRVVLDLESPVDYNASQLNNPDRLMIELRPAGGRPITSAPITSAPIAPEPVAPPAAVPASAPLQSASLTPVKEELAPLRETPAPVKETPAWVKENLSAIKETPTKETPTKETLKEKAPEPVKEEAAKPAVPPPLKEAADAPVRVVSPPLPNAQAARRMSSGDRTLIRELGLKVGRVVIDPGHGGHDQGSTGPGGLLEKDLVLDVARRLGKLIEERLGSEVIFTRTDDTFVSLEGRTALANETKADLFLSIHANSSPYPSVSGVETYYLNFASSREAMDLASRENAGAQETIHELPDIIQKITKHEKAEESREFAGKMQASLYSVAAKSNPSSKNRGVKKAPFVVLIGATMPSILAEIGFISNAHEESLLKRADHRQKLAEALYRGLARYAETLSHFQVAARD